MRCRTKSPACCLRHMEYGLTGVNSHPRSVLCNYSVYWGLHCIFTALQGLQLPLPLETCPTSTLPHICFAVRALHVLRTCNRCKPGAAQPSLHSPTVTTYSHSRTLRQHKAESPLTSPPVGSPRGVSKLPLLLALQGGSTGQLWSRDSQLLS